MTQALLPYQFEVDQSKSGMTAYAGMGIYLDFAHLIGLRRIIEEQVTVRQGTQGWTDSQMVMALVMLNIIGGNCVEDLNRMNSDEGLARLVRHVEFSGKSRRERRALERRWRKERTRGVPSPTAVFNYLEQFHNAAAETQRVAHTAFIPEPLVPLKGLYQVNRALLAWAQRVSPLHQATLDMDATIAPSQKQEALRCYTGDTGYQPFDCWWAERRVILHGEFRDGNVPAGYQQLRLLEESLAMLPPGVTEVAMRSDTAGYQWNLLRYCAEGKNERFGVITFAVSVDMTPEFKRAAGASTVAWRPLLVEVDGRLEGSAQEWAEVEFASHGMGYSKQGPEYRFIAIREPLSGQLELPDSAPPQLPFPTMVMQSGGGVRQYKVTAVVTNRTACGDEIIRWSRQRCGRSEQAHSGEKRDLAGGKLPSGKFGANAAWWAIMVVAFNLNALLKTMILGGGWVHKRMKAIRFAVIAIAGRVIERSRQVFVKISARHESLSLLLNARERMRELSAAAPW